MSPIKFVNGDEKKKVKKQKLVKHRRKNWAKTDISDVERQIDEFKKQKLAGGLLAEKKDEELFVINKKPTKLYEEADEDENNKDDLLKRKAKKSLDEKLKSLGCYRNLNPDPISAPAHVVRQNKEPKPNSKRQAKLAEKAKKKTELDKKKKKAAYQTAQPVAKKSKLGGDKFDVYFETSPTDDIWKSPRSKKKTENEVEENDYLKPTKKVPVKRRKNPLQKIESQNSKIELPHPGMSYNPDYDDHQKLLLKAHEIELKKLKREEKELRKLKDSVPKMSWKEIEELWLKEMSLENGLGDESTDENDDQEDEKSESVTTKGSNVASKKSAKQEKKESKLKRRRKQLEQKLKEKQKENEKKARIEASEIFRIKKILKEVNEKEKELEDKMLKKEILEKHKELFEPKRLGRVKFEEAEIDIKLSDEITGNLRTLKPEGNILRDSYKQMQKRNIIEPREKASKKGRRKYWKKTFDKTNAHEKTYFKK